MFCSDRYQLLQMMALIRVIAVALALASTTAWSPHPYESARDQYGVREDNPRPSQLLNEATVHHLKKVETLTPTPDLQVGCGEGHIHEKIHETDKNVIRKWKGFGVGNGNARRKRRSFPPWVQEQSIRTVPQYQSISVWKPPINQLRRPYFIPVYGVAGSSSIYYPPQPWPLNPGYPKDNPKKPFIAPTYLPPTIPTIEIKFGETTPMPMFEGRPVWGQSDNENPSATVRPTRFPKPAVEKTFPPLVHEIQDEQKESANRPSDYTLPNSEKESSVKEQNRPPQFEPSPNQPSKCVWAIISCCSSSGAVSYDCFEQRGCPGPFWGKLPCESDFAKSALAAALNYYEAK